MQPGAREKGIPPQNRAFALAIVMNHGMAEMQVQLMGGLTDSTSNLFKFYGRVVTICEHLK